jgi:excisionase family DNA binding protein
MLCEKLGRRYNRFEMVSRTGVEFTFDQAVKTLGVTPGRLERLIDEGKIAATRDGIHTFIPREAILEYLAGVSAVPLKQRQK